jgi:hypothetical protein
MGISPDERHQEDLLAVPENVHIIGVRLRNAVVSVQDQDSIAQELPIDMPPKAKQSVLLFPVVKSTRKRTQDATLIASALGVCVTL